MHEMILIEIIDTPAEHRRGRHNPRVVKRKMSNFPTKARAGPPLTAPIVRSSALIRIVAPMVEDTVLLSTALPQTASRPPGQACGRPSWHQHVRDWHASRLTRTAYCQSHDLEMYRFNQWVARLRRRLVL
ncbi:IS66 family insertion sequence element accessory protein TnpA [Microvirga calopogonii]|uniref:IS66 family insertion sequence element accessory protein TnpA n=1 Tax=Microvirga calopogonii TaxID=2078013 RepID=UPI0013B35848|nr:hypothetical protein [Microvirga calopogonii]